MDDKYKIGFMFFEFSKVFGFLLAPVHVLVIGALAASLWPHSGKRALSFRLMQAALALLLAMLLAPVGNLLLVPLETRFPPPGSDLGRVDGIVVLGGAVDEVTSAGQGHLSVNGAAERLIAPIALLQRHPQARLVFTGASGSLMPGMQKEGDFVRQFWRDAGIDKGQVLYEEKSRNTHENAVFSKELAQPMPGERWLLVTSAAHMPRSVAVFRKADFEVIAYPVGFKSTGSLGHWYVPRSAGGALGNVESAMHEYLGLLAYYLTGRIDDGFPAPR